MSVISDGPNIVQYTPIDVAVFRDAKEILERIRSIEIDSHEMKVYAAEELAKIKGLAKTIEAERVAAVAPLNNEVKAINNSVRPATKCLDEAETILKKAIASYRWKEKNGCL